ncbi:MAG: hypothetical protein GKC09_09400, partial [Methanosarcinales archaeon]|nr:hypothetical protein [Methanosarcinales archaeon]
PEKFSDDYYKVYGRPDLTVSLDSSRLYQGEKTSLFLTLANRGRVTSFQVNEEPGDNMKGELIAAQMELELEKQRTTAQDVSVLLRAENQSAIDIKRSVAFPGNIREGQTSSRLEFPLEAYENALPGSYRLLAQVNYTYQKDVAVKEDDDRPENPDVYYWYDSLSQTIPIDLIVERRSGAQFEVLNVTPTSLRPGSEGNVVRIRVKNVGDDRATDLVARLRPESGLYVSVDESPIPSLEPQEEAELLYKLDVSKDALPGKNYQLRILFQFSDSRRDDLTDWENAYLRIEEGGREWALAILLFLALLAAVLILAVRRSKKA